MEQAPPAVLEPSQSIRRAPSLRIPLRSKLILPYLLLALIVALTAAHLVTRVVLGSWTERFYNQLLTAADQSADLLVRQEEEQLATWRRIAFTEGMASAAAAGATGELERLVHPLFLLSDSAHVIVLDRAGRPLVERAAEGIQSDNVPYADWEVVRRIQQDPVNRYAGLLQVGDRTMFYTAGALQLPTGEPSGMLLVGTPLEQIAQQLDERLLVGISFYEPGGMLLVSTIGRADPLAMTVPPPLAAEVLLRQGEGSPIRTVRPSRDGFAQILLPFQIGTGEDVGILGVSLRLDLLASPLYPARWLIMGIFAFGVMAIIVIGYLLSAHILRPVSALTEASLRVAAGDLTVTVDTSSGDELAQLGESFNQMVSDLRHRRHVEDLFGRYVGDSIARHILSDEIESEGRRIEATVLFADIRDFTAYTEKTNLPDLMSELNEYYTMMQRIIDESGGVVNRFGGDSLLALFGAPLPHPEHPHHGVSAAVRMKEQLAILNDRRQGRGDLPFRVGIGVATGEMIVGNMGSTSRREYTVLGDAVNLAKRLSDLNKENELYTIFVNDATADAVAREEAWRLEPLGEISVRGKRDAVPVHALRDPHLTRSGAR